MHGIIRRRTTGWSRISKLVLPIFSTTSTFTPGPIQHMETSSNSTISTSNQTFLICAVIWMHTRPKVIGRPIVMVQLHGWESITGVILLRETAFESNQSKHSTTCLSSLNSTTSPARNPSHRLRHLLTYFRTCSTWPAFWMANLYSWPYGGEIDILEGVNNQYYNHYAFHVGGTCKQKGQSQTGIVETSNCNVYAPGQSSNAGCGGWATSAETYGDWMNYAGGGVYAMDWRTAGIRIWYFSPDNIPSDIQNGNPTTSGWGTVFFLVDLR